MYHWSEITLQNALELIKNYDDELTITRHQLMCIQLTIPIKEIGYNTSINKTT